MDINNLFGKVQNIASHHGVSQEQAQEMQTARKNSLVVFVVSVLITLATFGGLDQLYRSGSLNISNETDDTFGWVNDDNATDLFAGYSSEPISTLAEQ